MLSPFWQTRENSYLTSSIVHTKWSKFIGCFTNQLILIGSESRSCQMWIERCRHLYIAENHSKRTQNWVYCSSERSERGQHKSCNASRGYCAKNLQIVCLSSPDYKCYALRFGFWGTLGISSSRLRIAVGHRPPPNECSANHMAEKKT